MNSKSMAGWIGFAGILMVIVGGIDFFQGLIALFKDEYFVVTAVWLPRRRPDGVGLDHVDLGRAARSRRPRTTRRAGVGALVCDRRRVPELHRPARLPRQQPVSALVTDCDRAERDGALRADRALERERGGAQTPPASRLSWIEAVARDIVRDGLHDGTAFVDSRAAQVKVSDQPHSFERLQLETARALPRR